MAQVFRSCRAARNWYLGVTRKVPQSAAHAKSGETGSITVTRCGATASQGKHPDAVKNDLMLEHVHTSGHPSHRHQSNLLLNRFFVYNEIIPCPSKIKLGDQVQFVTNKIPFIQDEDLPYLALMHVCILPTTARVIHQGTHIVILSPWGQRTETH